MVAPVLAGTNTTQFYARGGAPIIVDPNITVTDVDSPTLFSALVQIIGALAGDRLAFTNNGVTQGNIIVALDAGWVILLQSPGGIATQAQWQSALDAVTFSTTSNSLGNRTVSFVVNDGVSISNLIDRVINVGEKPVITITNTNQFY